MFEFMNRRQAQDSNVTEEGLHHVSAAAGRWCWIKWFSVVQDGKEITCLMLDTTFAGPLAYHLLIQVVKLGDVSELVSSGFVSEKAAEPG